MKKNTVVELTRPDQFSDSLTELLRTGAKQLLEQAVEAELAGFMEQFSGKKLSDGKAAVVRNGYQPERNIQTGIGPVTVKIPKVRAKDGDPVTFRSALVPPYVRKTASLEAALPWLYLKGVSTGEMATALEVLVGPEVSGLSASTVSRLKQIWSEDYKTWCNKPLNKERWVYIWADGIYSGLRAEDARLCALRGIAKSSHHSYGSRRIGKALNARGYPVGRWKARRLMREAGVQVRYRKKYKVTTDSNHKQPVFENKLNRQFDVDRPDQAYVSDITYIWTQEGWLYLAVVIDLFSRKVVGWSMSSKMKAKLVCDALQMAVWQRQPQAGLTVHSDRGSQYACKQYRQLLKIHGFIGSMSRVGNCWDNSVAERFFGSLKQEQIHWQCYLTRYAAQQDVLQYISMFYNSQRLHSYLGYKSPNQYETEIEKLKNVA